VALGRAQREKVKAIFEEAKRNLIAVAGEAAVADILAAQPDEIAEAVLNRDDKVTVQDASREGAAESSMIHPRSANVKRAAKQPLYMVNQRASSEFNKEIDPTRPMVSSEEARHQKALLPKEPQAVLDNLVAHLHTKVDFSKRSHSECRWIKATALRHLTTFDTLTEVWTTKELNGLVDQAVAAVLAESPGERRAFYASRSKKAKATVAHWGQGEPTGFLDRVKGAVSRTFGKARQSQLELAGQALN